MSFLGKELSIFGARPVELYQFLNSPLGFFYTSADVDQTYLATTYTAIPMERGAIDLTKDIGKSQLQIQIPRTVELVNAFLQAPPDGQTLLTIFRNHVGDTDYVPYWKGRISSIDLNGSIATVTCDSDYTSLVGLGARATFSIPCRHYLYGPGCNVIDLDYKIDGVLNAHAGTRVTAAEFASQPDGWLSGGKFEVTVNSILYRRMILTHVGSDITLMYPIPGLQGSERCRAFAGCDHSLDGNNGCQKFRNSANHGGWPWKPVVNPFDGTPL